MPIFSLSAPMPSRHPAMNAASSRSSSMGVLMAPSCRIGRRRLSVALDRVGRCPTLLLPPRPPTRPRLLLLDGHSLAYRAFFALPVENFSTTTGQHTNAVYGFTSMLINVLRDEQPTHVAVAFDVSRQTFRLEEYAEYKAKRNKTPDEFSSQLPLIKEVLDALRIQHLEKDGYEADDIIATLVTQALAEGFEVLILTGDRDSFQLVTERLHRALPDARRLRAGPDDAGRGRGEVRRAARSATPSSRRSSGRPPTTCPACPGVGPDSRPSGSTSTTASTT